jgi:hypothetical protein
VAALDFFHDAHEDLVALVDSGFLLLDAGFIEVVDILEPFMQLDHSIDHEVRI